MSTIKISKKHLNKIDEIAIHHGFEFTRVPTSKTKEYPFLLPEEKEEVIKAFKKLVKNKKDILNPRMLYFDQPILINLKKPTKQRVYKNLNLDIIGVQKSIAEAMVINTATKILEEEGYKNIFIDINCTGDKNSMANFNDELLNYYKKNIDTLKEGCGGDLTKKDVSIIDCEHDCCQSLKENAPRPINFLSESSQSHLKEVLEYLEEMNIPYRINNDLVSKNNHYTKTIFEIKTNEGTGKKFREIVLARGGRYDDVANKIARKRNMSAVGISLEFKKINKNKAYSNKIEKPRIFLVQFGFKAKLKSFQVIDMLREEKITIYQSLHKEKLSEQFEEAKEMRIPFIIIIGQKEAMEDEVIVKNVKDYSNYTIKTNKLPHFFRKVKFV